MIDFHAHFLPPAYTDALKRHNKLTEDGFPTPAWDVNEHLRLMDAANIQTTILSVSSPHPYFGDAGEAAALARELNDYAAELCLAHPGRFLSALTLPVPDVDASIAELRRMCPETGPVLVKLPSNAAGVYPGAPELEALFAELDARRAIVILHPTRPPAVPGGCYTGVLLPLFEFLGDTTRCVVNLITSGTLERHPGLRIVVPHCGSFLPNILSRLTSINALMVSRGLADPVDVQRSMASLYFDVAGDILPSGLEILETIAAPEHILFGSDYPYTPAAQILAKLAAQEAALPADKRQRIYTDNAMQLLNS